MLNTVKSLGLRREIAANASKGISSEPIYKTFEEVINRLDVRGDCLDFGAGLGNLTCRLQLMNRFSSITATDLINRPNNLDDSIMWINNDLNIASNFPPESFNTIVASEVIEHLENPRFIAREWFRLLRPGGTLIISTPNNESFRSLLSLVWRGHFIAFSDTCYPAHITALLRKDIERILTEVGFSTPEFVFTNIGGIPKLPQFTWQQASQGLLQGLRYSDNLLAIAYKGI